MTGSKFNGMYEYMGFAITNDGEEHEWNVEPITDDIKKVEVFKRHVPVLKTLAQAKKWIRETGSKIEL